MITSTRVFGSYRLQRVTELFDDECVDVSAEAEGMDNVEASGSSKSCAKYRSTCTIPPEWTDLQLLEVIKYNHDTSLFRFSLPRACSHLQLPVGGFLLVKAPNREHGGGDAVRPYTSVSDDGENDSVHSGGTGTFQILCKRYAEWGQKENPQTHFLFTKTDHSYRPPGAVSTYIHELVPGDTLQFKHTNKCIGKLACLFPPPIEVSCATSSNLDGFAPSTNELLSKGCVINTFTMIAVGVGVAPMIHTLRYIFSRSELTHIQVVLLYGVRTVADILLRETLENWRRIHPDRFRLVYCVGSRWANVHMGAKTKDEYTPPPLPKGYEELMKQTPAEVMLGWVNEDKIRNFAFPPSHDTKVLVCGLPGVYDKLCGPRDMPTIGAGSALAKLGYTQDMVIKL